MLTETHLHGSQGSRSSTHVCSIPQTFYKTNNFYADSNRHTCRQRVRLQQRNRSERQLTAACKRGRDSAYAGCCCCCSSIALDMQQLLRRRRQQLTTMICCRCFFRESSSARRVGQLMTKRKMHSGRGESDDCYCDAASGVCRLLLQLPPPLYYVPLTRMMHHCRLVLCIKRL